MKKLLPALSVLSLFFLTSFGLSAQSESNSVVLHLEDFTTEKNLRIYEHFKQDQQVKVVNSCDILGLVVLEPLSENGMSRSDTRAYTSVRLTEIMHSEEFDFYMDMSKMEVLMNCRAAMQEELTPEGN